MFRTAALFYRNPRHALTIVYCAQNQSFRSDGYRLQQNFLPWAQILFLNKVVIWCTHSKTMEGIYSLAAIAVFHGGQHENRACCVKCVFSTNATSSLIHVDSCLTSPKFASSRYISDFCRSAISSDL